MIRSVKQGIKRAHAERGTQRGVRRPKAWDMLTRMQDSVPILGSGGKGGVDRLDVV